MTHRRESLWAEVVTSPANSVLVRPAVTDRASRNGRSYSELCTTDARRPTRISPNWLHAVIRNDPPGSTREMIELDPKRVVSITRGGSLRRVLGAVTSGYSAVHAVFELTAPTDPQWHFRYSRACSAPFCTTPVAPTQASALRARHRGSCANLAADGPENGNVGGIQPPPPRAGNNVWRRCHRTLAHWATTTPPASPYDGRSTACLQRRSRHGRVVGRHRDPHLLGSQWIELSVDASRASPSSS